MKTFEEIERKFRIGEVDVATYVNHYLKNGQHPQNLKRPILRDAAITNKEAYEFLENNHIEKPRVKFELTNHDWTYDVDWTLEDKEGIDILLGYHGTGKTRILKEFARQHGAFYYYFQNIEWAKQNQRSYNSYCLSPSGDNLLYLIDNHKNNKDVKYILSIWSVIFRNTLPIKEEFPIMGNGSAHLLLQAIAVAIAPSGSIICIECPERSLHPDLLNRLLGLFDILTQGNDKKVILTTYSSTLLSNVVDDVYLVWSLEYGIKRWPIPVEDLILDYQGHYELGSLYNMGFFGNIRPPTHITPHPDWPKNCSAS